MFKSITRALKASGRAVPVVVTDIAGLSGAGFVSYGAWMLAPPAGFIVGGILLMAGAMLASAKSDRPS